MNQSLCHCRTVRPNDCISMPMPAAIGQPFLLTFDVIPVDRDGSISFLNPLVSEAKENRST